MRHRKDISIQCNSSHSFLFVFISSEILFYYCLIIINNNSLNQLTWNNLLLTAEYVLIYFVYGSDPITPCCLNFKVSHGVLIPSKHISFTFSISHQPYTLCPQGWTNECISCLLLACCWVENILKSLNMGTREGFVGSWRVFCFFHHFKSITFQRCINLSRYFQGFVNQVWRF